MRWFARDAIELINLVYGRLIKLDATRVMPTLTAIAANPCTVTSIVFRIMDFAGLAILFVVGTLRTRRSTDVLRDGLFFRFPAIFLWLGRFK